MENVIYTFWTGNNEMSSDRKYCLDTIVNKSKSQVILVTPSNLGEYVLPNKPLHPAYDYLSLTHKADYLRCYFMHHLGGGYSDIKKTSSSWEFAFDDLRRNESTYANGYPELNEDCVAMVGGQLYQYLRANYRKVIGCSAFICKPHTPFTTDWYVYVSSRLDSMLPYLKSSPATHPQEKYGMMINGKMSTYPLQWTEILGNVFHPLCLKYADRIIQTLPRCEFEQPYR